MSPNDGEYRQWQERVNERLASLTSSETVQNDLLDEVDDDLHKIREILEGNPKDKHDNGVKGDIHDLSVSVNELRALMAPDHLGQGGIIARIKSLEHKVENREKWADRQWTFWGMVIVSLISASGLILTNVDKIASAFRTIAPNSPVFDHPKPKKPKRKVVKPCNPNLEECQDSSQTNQ